MLLILVLPFVLSHWSFDFFAVIQVISFLKVGFILKGHHLWFARCFLLQ